MPETDRIFLIDGQDKIKEIPHCQYESEDHLQRLIDEHPTIIVG